MTQTNSKLQSLLTQRSNSALHCFWNLNDWRPRLGMLPQLRMV